jgi:hypothetical protein
LHGSCATPEGDRIGEKAGFDVLAMLASYNKAIVPLFWFLYLMLIIIC